VKINARENAAPIALAMLGGDCPGDPDTLVEHIAARLAVAAPVALERAASLYAWKRIWQSRNGADRGGDRKSTNFRARNQNEKISFCSAAATRLGLTERAIQLDVQLAEDLGIADIRRLWDAPIADNAAALRILAALAPDRRAVIYKIWDRDPHLSFNAALVAARLKAERDSEEDAFNRLHDAWSSANARVRRRFLAQIGADKRLIDSVIRPDKARVRA
jgi:hypothetical protein